MVGKAMFSNETAAYAIMQELDIDYVLVIFEHLEEAFTSEHWIVRIFKVKKPANR